MSEQDSFQVPDAKPDLTIDTRGRSDGRDSISQRVQELEKSVHRLRVALYCGLAIVLMAGVWGAEWLFVQSVRRVDEASGSIQTQFDQRAKSSRLYIERELKEIRGQLETLGGKPSPDNADASDIEAPPNLDR